MLSATRYAPGACCSRSEHGHVQAYAEMHAHYSAHMRASAAVRARSVPARLSDVSCDIVRSAGASAAAPASPREFPAHRSTSLAVCTYSEPSRRKPAALPLLREYTPVGRRP